MQRPGPVVVLGGVKLLHEGLDAVKLLLPALKDQQVAPFELLTVLRQKPGHDQQDGGVPVVPAGVHHAVHGRAAGAGPCQVTLAFLHGQRIHVGAQQQRFAGQRALNRGNNAALFNFPVGDAEPIKLGANGGNGAALLQ